MNKRAVHRSQFVYVNGDRTPVLSVLSYTTRDPFTVALAFRVQPGDWVEWEFARDLLAAGLSGPVGIGDIRIRPGSAADDVLVLELDSSDGYAAVEMSHAEVSRFLDATHALVPPGTEGRHLDLDALIASLMTTRP